MATSFKTFLATALLIALPMGPAHAGRLDQPSEGSEVAKANPSEGPAKRTLEITQATGQLAMKAFASPAAFSHWIDDHRDRRVAIGITIAR